MAQNKHLSEHINKACDLLAELLKKHTPEIVEMINNSEGLETNLPVKVLLNLAPGSQRVDVTVSLVTKETHSLGAEIDIDQIPLALEDKKKKTGKKSKSEDAPQ